MTESLEEPSYLVVADPQSKRWRHYSRELNRFWTMHHRSPVIKLLSWCDVIARDGRLDLSDFSSDAVVRIESPARDVSVLRQLLLAGARVENKPVEKWLAIDDQKGWLMKPGLAFAGLKFVLKGLRDSFNELPQHKLTACPASISEMFDKNGTLKRLAAAGIPTPETMSPPANAQDLMAKLREQRYFSAYVKLNHGSSASGIAVVHPTTYQPFAITSILRKGEHFFNTRKLHSVNGMELERTLDFILGEGATIQRGIPMAQIDGQNFDVRVIVIDGEPAFTIFRLSRNPMTNLHLGGRRGETEHCRSLIPKRIWLDAVDDCVSAANCYQSTVVGVDLLFEQNFTAHYILELNAFGDFFPGWTNEPGKTVHEFEIERTAQRYFSQHLSAKIH